MDLKNRHDHMRGKRVMVNGHLYDIAPDGVARGVEEPDAAKLLAGDAWSVYTSRAPVTQPVPVAMPAPAPQPQPAPEALPPPPPPEAEDIPEPEVPEDQPEEPQGGTTETDEAEWPDPNETMTLEFLQEMASAYEVQYTARTSKATLIKRIMAAMYPDGK